MDCGSKKMNFLQIPEEVVEGHILPFLLWNDLLRFRRVCKLFHNVTTGYMRVHPSRAPELEINEDDHNFAAFLRMKIPTTKLFLNNSSGHKFFQTQHEAITEFLEKYGSMVKSLRVKELSIHLHGHEWDFIDKLVNLESYNAGSYGLGEKFSNAEEFDKAESELFTQAKQDPRFLDHLIPPILQNLKSFQIGHDGPTVTGNLINRYTYFINVPSKLQHLMLPFNSAVNEQAFLPDPFEILGITFSLLDVHIQHRVEMLEVNGNLKSIDFCNFHDDPRLPEMIERGSRSFLQLCGTALENNVKLYNVDCYWFLHRRQRNVHPELTNPKFGLAIASMINIHPEVFDLELENLEKVEIRHANLCKIPTFLLLTQLSPIWPALKSIVIFMDQQPSKKEARNLFLFFFCAISRPSVEEVRLAFEGDPAKLVVPKMAEVAASCSNLKKLAIKGWPGTNKNLTRLWSGLKNLEEVSFDCCKELGNVAFVGEDIKNPVFLKLQKLRKLSLKGLDHMPKITDTLFSMVIRHLSLTDLTITSDSAVNSVTLAGVESLLNGEFAKSISKFRFQEWSLANASQIEWQYLEQKFRSFNML